MKPFELIRPIEIDHSLKVKCRHLDKISIEWVELFDFIDASFEVQLELLMALGRFFSFMPGESSSQANDLPKNICKFNNISETVTFYGGSFKPFHQGHQACLDLCPEENIIVIPDLNPLKEKKNNQIVLKDYLDLVQKLSVNKVSLYPGFLGKNELNPTVDWLPFVQSKIKNLLVGDDTFLDFQKWKNPQELFLHINKLYVVPRNFTHNDYQSQINWIKSLNQKIDIIILPEHPFMDISSTKIRK